MGRGLPQDTGWLNRSKAAGQFAKEAKSGVVMVWIRDTGGKWKHLEDIVKRIRGGESTKNEKT